MNTEQRLVESSSRDELRVVESKKEDGQYKNEQEFSMLLDSFRYIGISGAQYASQHKFGLQDGVDTEPTINEKEHQVFDLDEILDTMRRDVEKEVGANSDSSMLQDSECTKTSRDHSVVYKTCRVEHDIESLLASMRKEVEEEQWTFRSRGIEAAQDIKDAADSSVRYKKVETEQGLEELLDATRDQVQKELTREQTSHLESIGLGSKNTLVLQEDPYGENESKNGSELFQMKKEEQHVEEHSTDANITWNYNLIYEKKTARVNPEEFKNSMRRNADEKIKGKNALFLQTAQIPHDTKKTVTARDPSMTHIIIGIEKDLEETLDSLQEHVEKEPSKEKTTSQLNLASQNTLVFQDNREDGSRNETDLYQKEKEEQDVEPLDSMPDAKKRVGEKQFEVKSSDVEANVTWNYSLVYESKTVKQNLEELLNSMLKDADEEKELEKPKHLMQGCLNMVLCGLRTLLQCRGESAEHASLERHDENESNTYVPKYL